MGKRKALSSESDDENANLNKLLSLPEKQLKQLILRTANLTSKSGLLQKVLENSDIPLTSRKLSVKSKRKPDESTSTKKRKREEVSSSHDSSSIEGEIDAVSEKRSKKKKSRKSLESKPGASTVYNGISNSSKIKTTAPNRKIIKEVALRSDSNDSEITNSLYLTQADPVSDESSNDGDQNKRNQLLLRTASLTPKNKFSSDNDEYVNTNTKKRKNEKLSSSHNSTFDDGDIQAIRKKGNNKKKSRSPAGLQDEEIEDESREKSLSINKRKSPKKKKSLESKPVTSTPYNDISNSSKIKTTKKGLYHTQVYKGTVSDENSNDSDKNGANVSTGLVNGDVSDARGRYRSYYEETANNEHEESMITDSIVTTKQNQSRYASEPETSPRSKVNVLQDIRFTPESPEKSLKKLSAMYPGIKRIEANLNLEFSDYEDVYLLRIPKNVDPRQLRKVDIDLEHDSKINIGKKYNIVVSSKVPDPMLVLSRSCQVVSFKSDLRIKKYIKSKKQPKIEIPERTSVPFPANLKKRHPLFGPNFKQKIKLSEEVEHKLDEASANMLKQEKKFKKKKHKKKSIGEETNNEEDIFNLFNEN